MADVLAKGSLFPEILVPELVNLVKGHSSLAKMVGDTPIAFAGNREFTFTLDKEIDVVAENGAKTKGGATIAPVTIVPIKVEYGARVSDEFMYASEEAQLNILRGFAEGFAKKLARGLDIMAMHGYNPRTGTASNVIGTNHFDSKVTNVVNTTNDADVDVESAVAMLTASDAQATGLIVAPTFRASLASAKTSDGARLYPELAWGGKPANLNGLAFDANPTMAFSANPDKALVGDFEAFKWGYAKEIPMQVIEYGNPDNDATLGDLKGHNQVYLRAEAYIGWGILDPNAFAIVRTEEM